ncbi:MAG: hypothetical protein WC804_17265 [Sphingomonas sp.]|uniref:hypothetical protein n=1 Tax=Sphingomonas sp. TaxID=28214 RepID=UPI0035663EC0
MPAADSGGAALGHAPIAERSAVDARATIWTYLALAICFAITNFTNQVILDIVRGALNKSAEWPLASARRMIFAAGDYYDQYLLASIKDTAFALCLLVLGFLVRHAFAALRPTLPTRARWVDILIALVIAGILLCQITPTGMGRVYGYVSVEPFLQQQGFYHRRILLSVLAHDLHLGGVFYPLFSWALAIMVVALADIYLRGKGLLLSRIELASLWTVGIFSATLALPGYVECGVLGLTLLALITFERSGHSNIVQPICFGLALLTHETAAVLAFGTLALCAFDRRFLLHFAAILAMYLFIWLASYGFDVGRGAATQLTGGSSNLARFLPTLPLVVIALFASYKLTIAAIAMATIRFAATRDFRRAALIAIPIVGGVALTAIATDYTRMISFGTFALLVALPPTLMRLSARQRRGWALANLLVPTLYVAARAGVVAYPGLYGLVLTHGFGMRG